MGHIGRAVPVLLHALVREGTVQHGEMHHGLFRPVALILPGRGPFFHVGGKQRARPALRGPAHGLSPVVDARPEKAAHAVILFHHIHPGTFLGKILEARPLAPEKQIGFRSQNGPVGDLLMDPLIPLLLIVAA